MQRAVSIYGGVGGKLTGVERVGGGTDAAYAALVGKPVMCAMGQALVELHARPQW